MFNANMPSLSDIAAVTGNDRDSACWRVDRLKVVKDLRL